MAFANTLDSSVLEKLFKGLQCHIFTLKNFESANQTAFK